MFRVSYDFTVHLRSAKRPSSALLSEKLALVKSRVTLAKPLELATAEGYQPVRLDGKPTGFEVFSSEVTEKDRERHRRRLERHHAEPDEYLEMLTACDLSLGLSCRASDQSEVTAARIVAKAVAAIADGWFDDPQTGETLRFAPKP